MRIDQDYALAFKADRTAMRLTSRLGFGIPTLAKSVRKVLVSSRATSKGRQVEAIV